MCWLSQMKWYWTNIGMYRNGLLLFRGGGGCNCKGTELVMLGRRSQRGWGVRGLQVIVHFLLLILQCGSKRNLQSCKGRCVRLSSNGYVLSVGQEQQLVYVERRIEYFRAVKKAKKAYKEQLHM